MGSLFSNQFVVVNFLSAQTKYQQCFSDVSASTKDISLCQNLFNCANEKLPPNFIWNLLYDVVEGKYQEKNLIEFLKCHPCTKYS